MYGPYRTLDWINARPPLVLCIEQPWEGPKSIITTFWTSHTTFAEMADGDLLNMIRSGLCIGLCLALGAALTRVGFRRPDQRCLRSQLLTGVGVLARVSPSPSTASGFTLCQDSPDLLWLGGPTCTASTMPGRETSTWICGNAIRNTVCSPRPRLACNAVGAH